jgi:hypothetical protein
LSPSNCRTVPFESSVLNRSRITVKSHVSSPRAGSLPVSCRSGIGGWPVRDFERGKEPRADPRSCDRLRGRIGIHAWLAGWLHPRRAVARRECLRGTETFYSTLYFRPRFPSLILKNSSSIPDSAPIAVPGASAHSVTSIMGAVSQGRSVRPSSTMSIVDLEAGQQHRLHLQEGWCTDSTSDHG